VEQPQKNRGLIWEGNQKGLCSLLRVVLTALVMQPGNVMNDTDDDVT
jgi:hypothetical protein